MACRCIFLGFTALSDPKWANIYLKSNCQSGLKGFNVLFLSYLYYNPKDCYVAKLRNKLATIMDKLFRDLFRLLLCYHSWSHCFHYFVEKSFFTIFKKLSNFCLPSFRLSHRIDFLSLSKSISWLHTRKTSIFLKFLNCFKIEIMITI